MVCCNLHAASTSPTKCLADTKPDAVRARGAPGVEESGRLILGTDRTGPPFCMSRVAGDLVERRLFDHGLPSCFFSSPV